MRSCCRQSLHAFTSRYDSTLLGRTFLHRRCFCISIIYTHEIRRLTNGITVMCINRGFMVGLGNNGFSNPIISCCLEISSAYNPFSSRFPFPTAFHCREMFAGLTAYIIYHSFYHLVTMHVCETVGIYWNKSYLRLFLSYKRLLANNKLFIKASTLQYAYYCI